MWAGNFKGYNGSKMQSNMLLTREKLDFELSRKFYEEFAYPKEAGVQDFGNDVDDKVIYWKQLY